MKRIWLLLLPAILCAATIPTSYLFNLDGTITAYIPPSLQIDDIRTDTRLTKKQRDSMLKEAQARFKTCQKSHKSEANWLVTPDAKIWQVLCRKCGTTWDTKNHPFPTTVQ
jgi:hypothetical protein